MRPGTRHLEKNRIPPGAGSAKTGGDGMNSFLSRLAPEKGEICLLLLDNSISLMLGTSFKNRVQGPGCRGAIAFF